MVFTIEKYLLIFILKLHVALNKRKIKPFIPSRPHTIWHENRWVIVTSLSHEPLALVTSFWPIILTLFLWTLYLNGVGSQGRFSMAVHRCCIYRSVLLGFRGRIENDHSYGLRCRGLCCHLGTALMGRSVRLHDGWFQFCCAGVAAQANPVQTVSWPIPITNHSSHFKFGVHTCLISAQN